MVLIPHSAEEDFSGLLLDIHTPRARGIFDLDKSRDLIRSSVEEFFQARGVATVAGFRPGIGATSGGPTGWVAQIAKLLPTVGKLIFATISTARVLRKRITEYKKRKMRPFKPSVGIHLDMWPATDARQRTPVSTLIETLSLLPDLCGHIDAKHPGMKPTFLVTGNSERISAPAIRIDSDACSDSSVVKLAATVRKGLERPIAPTHFTLSRQWGFWERVRTHWDENEAFHLVFLFPGDLQGTK